MSSFINSWVFILLFFLTVAISGVAGHNISIITQEQQLMAGVVLGCIGVYGWWFVSYKIEKIEKTYQNLDRLTKETLHELNIPVATIEANVEMIDHATSDTKTKKRLERIIKSTQALKELYRQLDYTIRQEIFTPAVVLVDIKDVVEERIHLLSDRFGNIDVTWNIESIITPINVIAMGRIFDNILINALKYNKEKGSISIYTKGNELIVSDTGKGISPQSMLHIFDQYYQVDEKTEGYGLGLSIVKHYCDLYKIGLHIDSVEDQGTSVHLIFKKTSTISPNPLDKQLQSCYNSRPKTQGAIE